MPHFQSGDRVRLAVEFVGNIWDADGTLTAGEGVGPNGRGNPIIFPAGSTGTVGPGQSTSPQASYLVIMDDGRMTTLSVRGANLESISGRARFRWEGDMLRVVQAFDIQDIVRLIRQVTEADGTTYEAGTVAAIRPGDLSMSAMQRMEQSWETDNYDIFIPRNETFLSVSARVLQLDSDFRPSAQAKFDTSAKRDVWAVIVADLEGDNAAFDAVLASGDHTKMLVYATARLMAYLREQGDPVAYARSMVEAITEKEASDGLDADGLALRDMWSLVVAAGDEDEEAANAVLARCSHEKTLIWAAIKIETYLGNQGRDPLAYGHSMIEAINRRIVMANVKVTCPHCGHQTWVREHYNDPCQHCGKTVPDPHVR